MFSEPTTLASLTGLLATSLRDGYGVDPAPIFSEAGVELSTAGSPRLRHPIAKMRRLWMLSREATGDETLGLQTGWYAKPGHFYAFGHSWLASATLYDALNRLTRYSNMLSTTVDRVSLTETADSYALATTFGEGQSGPPKEGKDCAMTALLALCDIVAEKKVSPLRVELTCPANVHPDAYRQALRAPVSFNADVGTFHFDKDLLKEPLPHGSTEIAKATDRIVEDYLDALDPNKVASQVRRLLIHLLPSGNVNQDVVAHQLNRSKSTLQRQLKTEGLSYRDVLESTQRSLAENYLTDKKHSHAEIAYLLGFSDQSNFSRAFKRWTSMSPRQFQESAGR